MVSSSPPSPFLYLFLFVSLMFLMARFFMVDLTLGQAVARRATALGRWHKAAKQASARSTLISDIKSNQETFASILMIPLSLLPLLIEALCYPLICAFVGSSRCCVRHLLQL